MTGVEKKSQPVTVYIRQRPFSIAEVESKCASIVHKITSREVIIKSGFIEKSYKFDQVFGGDVSQVEIYNTVISPLIDYTICGYNCTTFAYGQTGTGKTHTIIGGNIANFSYAVDDPSLGIIPRASAQLFTELAKLPVKTEYTVRISLIEIYNEEVRDLLQESTPLRIYDDPENKGSVYIKGLTEVTVCNTDSVFQWLNIGLLERQTAATNLNSRSSRSHTIFTFLINTREITSTGDELVKAGKLHLVDLAGSENIGRSGSTNVRAREAGTINRSLLTLGKVIKALAQKMQHIPYRDSKLTRILQDSLGGNTKTCMIATFSPCINAWDETQSTLDYALLARNVSNCPLVNVNRKQANVVKEFEVEIDKLKHELQIARSGTGFYVSSEHYKQMSEENKNNHQRILELIQEIRDLEDYKQTKNQEYAELTESFKNSKMYVNQVRKELVDQSRIVKQKDVIVNYMQERDDKMTKNLEQLLKICETSTTHKNIYYEKLDLQRNATTDNAKIGQDMLAFSLNTLRQIQDVTKEHNKSMDTRISEAREGVKFLNESYIEGLEHINGSSKEIQESASNLILHSQDFLTNSISRHSYSDENSISFCDTAFNNLLKLTDLTQINESVDSLKLSTTSRNTHLEKKSVDCCNTIDNKILRTEEQLQSFKNLLDRITTDYAEASSVFQQRVSTNIAFKKTLLKYIEKSHKEEHQLNNKLAQLQNVTKRMMLVTEKPNDEQNVNSINHLLNDYIQFQSETVSQQMLTANEISDTVKEKEDQSDNQITSNKSKVGNYFAEGINTIKGNLDAYNTDFKNVIGSWVTKVNQMKDYIFKKAINKTEKINKNIELISQDQTQYKSEIDGIVQESSTNLERLKSRIGFNTHAGDTPVKTNIRYPKRLPEFISPTKLLKNLDEDLVEENAADFS